MAHRLLIDEDVRFLLAETLRRRGYDAVHVLERNRGGRSDPDQLDFAVTQRRAILTHNIAHFVVLDREYHATRKTHYGILVCNQVPFRELLRRTLRCLSRLTAEEVHNRVALSANDRETVGWA
jgi:predicted nuclease of predicted toxin-antitoxin system